MIPHVTPSFWPDPIPPARLAAAFARLEREDAADAGAVRAAAGGCSVALIGMPDETGVRLNGGRPGAAEGPHAFRAALARYGVGEPVELSEGKLRACPPLPRVLDVGDVTPAADIHETHRRVTAAVRAVLDLGLFPIGIGGGHDLTFPFVRALSEGGRGGPLHGIYFDAHLDVRAEVGSGMPFRRLIEDCGVASLTCIGLDPHVNSATHGAWFREHRGSAPATPPPPSRLFPAGEPRDLFVSLDLDVLDMAYAPGVSAMNPCGLDPRTIGDAVEAAGACPAVRCFDIMELSPANDHAGRTARLAAHLFVRFLHGFARRSRTAETPHWPENTA